MWLKLILIFFALCLIQMMPWIVENLLLNNNEMAWIWSIGSLISIGLLWVIIQWTNRKGLTKIVWGLNGFNKRTVLYLFLVGLISYGFVFLVRLGIGGFQIIGTTPFDQLWTTLARCLFITFYIAFSEEIIFRGFVYSSLRRKYSAPIAVSGSLVLFVLFHLPKWESLLTSPYLFHLIASGLVFTLVYLKSNTLWHSISIHWGWNMGAFALVEFKEPLLLTQKLSSHGWFDLSGWVSVLIYSLLIYLIIKVYSRKLTRNVKTTSKL